MAFAMGITIAFAIDDAVLGLFGFAAGHLWITGIAGFLWLRAGEDLDQLSAKLELVGQELEPLRTELLRLYTTREKELRIKIEAAERAGDPATVDALLIELTVVRRARSDFMKSQGYASAGTRS